MRTSQKTGLGMKFREIPKAMRIVPVIVIKQLGHAVALAKALVEGGLNVLEITLRTDAAPEAISARVKRPKQAVPIPVFPTRQCPAAAGRRLLRAGRLGVLSGKSEVSRPIPAGRSHEVLTTGSQGLRL
jgi:KDPG/KHG aldolase